MVSTSLQASEMMVASGSVIGARMTIMGSAARVPWRATTWRSAAW
jgi:hypothetical protein